MVPERLCDVRYIYYQMFVKLSEMFLNSSNSLHDRGTVVLTKLNLYFNSFEWHLFQGVRTEFEGFGRLFSRFLDDMQNKTQSVEWEKIRLLPEGAVSVCVCNSVTLQPYKETVF